MKYFAYSRVSPSQLSSSSKLTFVTWPRSWCIRQQTLLIYKQFHDPTGNTRVNEPSYAFPKICCHEKATVPSCIPLSYMSLNNTQLFSNVMERQQWSLLHCSRATNINTDVNNINTLRSSRKMSWFFCSILNNGEFSQQTLKKACIIAKIRQVAAVLMHAENTWWHWRTLFATMRRLIKER